MDGQGTSALPPHSDLNLIDNRRASSSANAGEGGFHASDAGAGGNSAGDVVNVHWSAEKGTDPASREAGTAARTPRLDVLGDEV